MFLKLVDINASTREDSELTPIEDDAVEIPPPSHNEARVAIQRFKNNLAVGPDGLLLSCVRPAAMSWKAACTSLSREYGWKKA